MSECTTRRWYRLPQNIANGHIAYLIVLLGILSGAASFLLLLELIEDIGFEHAPGTLDLRIFHWVQDLRSPVFDGLFMSITRMGNAPALLAVAATGGALLLLARRILEAFAMAICFAGSAASVMALKWLLQRDRPASPLQLILADNPAFPSAHASLSLVVYVFAAYLVSRQPGTIGRRLLILSVGFGFAFLIGLSRLYLGVHWLSDVLGGYALGGMWLALLVTISEFRRIEHPAPRLDNARHTLVTWGVFSLIPALILFLLLYSLDWQIR